MRHAIIGLAAITLAGCSRAVGQSATADVAPIPMVSDVLKLGRGIPGGGTVSDSAWALFVAEVVTPRFPDGFGVIRGEVQWRYADGTIGKEDNFTLELTHPAGSPPDSTFENIAKEYIRRFHQEAVFRVRTPAQGWMYTAPKKN